MLELLMLWKMTPTLEQCFFCTLPLHIISVCILTLAEMIRFCITFLLEGQNAPSVCDL